MYRARSDASGLAAVALERIRSSHTAQHLSNRLCYNISGHPRPNADMRANRRVCATQGESQRCVKAAVA